MTDESRRSFLLRYAALALATAAASLPGGTAAAQDSPDEPQFRVLYGPPPHRHGTDDGPVHALYGPPPVKHPPHRDNAPVYGPPPSPAPDTPKS